MQGSQNLEVGLAVHTGLEILKAGKPLEEALKYADYEFTSATKKSARIVSKLQIQGWQSRWKNDGLTYLENELSFEFEDLRGVIDGIARDYNGKTVLVEHKTTESKLDESSFYWNRYDIPWQLDIYIHAAEKLGYTIDYCILDVIRVPPFKIAKATPKNKQQFYTRKGKYGDVGDPKPGTRLKAETMPEFQERVMKQLAAGVYDNFVRKEITRTKADVAATLNDWAEIVKLQQVESYPRSPGSCRMGRYECDFLPICMNETNLNNARLYQLRPRRSD